MKFRLEVNNDKASSKIVKSLARVFNAFVELFAFSQFQSSSQHIIHCIWIWALCAHDLLDHRTLSAVAKKHVPIKICHVNIIKIFEKMSFNFRHVSRELWTDEYCLQNYPKSESSSWIPFTMPKTSVNINTSIKYIPLHVGWIRTLYPFKFISFRRFLNTFNTSCDAECMK